MCDNITRSFMKNIEPVGPMWAIHCDRKKLALVDRNLACGMIFRVRRFSFSRKNHSSMFLRVELDLMILH